MTDHISFEEMVELIYAESYDQRLDKLSARANSHMLVCDECYETYNNLLELKDFLDEKAGRNSMDEVYPKFLMALSQTCGIYESEKTFDFEEISRLMNSGVENAVFSLAEGKLEFLSGTYPFFELTGISGNVIAKGGLPSADVPSEHCDTANNRITFKDGRLTVRIPLKGYSADDVLFLVSDSLDRSEYSLLEQSDNNYFEANIGGLPDGTYTVILGKECKKLLPFADRKKQKRETEEHRGCNCRETHFCGESEAEKLKRLEERVSRWNKLKNADNTVSIDRDGLNARLRQQLNARKLGITGHAMYKNPEQEHKDSGGKNK